jgi:hypothetical protein
VDRGGVGEGVDVLSVVGVGVGVGVGGGGERFGDRSLFASPVYCTHTQYSVLSVQ